MTHLLLMTQLTQYDSFTSLSAENEELQEREREREVEQNKLIKDLEALRYQLEIRIYLFFFES